MCGEPEGPSDLIQALLLLVSEPLAIWGCVYSETAMFVCGTRGSGTGPRRAHMLIGTGSETNHFWDHLHSPVVSALT